MNLQKIGLSLALSVCIVFPLYPKDQIPERFRKWLETEVVYIISPAEKNVFLQLADDRERDLFVRAFWQHRDPSPGDTENEFQREHYRRIQQANHLFGRGTTKKGWQTDQGRMYIILGEPNDIQRFESLDQVYPAEVWFYQGMSHRGLPSAFHLVFFQEGGIGEYRLYSPLSDGPQALMNSYYGDPMDYLSAYKELRDLEPELAAVSLALIPGESAFTQGRPSLTSDLMINRIETIPQNEVKDRYAQKFLEYKDVIEVEYSTNFIDSDSLVFVTRDPSGIVFVHYAIEPERLSLKNFEDKYYTTLRLNGTVTDTAGKTIYQFEKEIPLEFGKEQLSQISQRPVSIRDMFPMVPGDFRLSVLLQNEASQEFASLEHELHIPSGNERPLMSSLLLGYRMERKPVPQQSVRPFQSAGNQIFFQSNRVFLQEDELVVAFQIQGLESAQKERAKIRYSLYQEDQEIQSYSKAIDQYPDAPDYLEVLPLLDLPPAHYRIQVSLYVEGEEVMYVENEFDITFSQNIPRPWVYNKLLAEIHDPVYAFVLGNQKLNLGEIREAGDYLQTAYEADPKNMEFALGLARVYSMSLAFDKIPPLLSSFLLQSDPPRFEVYVLLGEAYRRLGEYPKAVSVFQEALVHHGVTVPVLNALGDCFAHQDRTIEALSAWERSLQIDPEQPAVASIVKRMKEKERCSLQDGY